MSADRLAKVPIFANPRKAVTVNLSATNGAQIGINLFDPNGKLVAWSDIANSKATAAPSIGTTDDLDEGRYNLYFTPKRAQDAVGSILQDSDSITLRYDPSAPSIQANLIEITATALTDLSYPNVVAVDGEGNAYYPDLTNPTDVARIVGITKHAAAAGASIAITQNHTFTETAWNWSPGRIFCGSNGALTQTVPAAGALVEVARVISPTTIRVGIQVGILRAA